jgi:hypoxanthine-DNA glycosylase
LGEYYAHPRNRFWKIISTLTKNDFPISYDAKKKLLFTAKIGIWDVAHKVIREGSLDNAIKNEEPNDLESFIKEHKKLKLIVFNGQKAEKLFKKHFSLKSSLNYISLPSTSPANTGINFYEICEEWEKILD